MSGPRIGALFAGMGGLEMGVQAVLGGTVAWHSEIDPGATKILTHRYPHVPNLGDVERVGLPYSDEEWKQIKAAQQFQGGYGYEMPVPDWSDVEPVDVLTLGFPCQDVSGAGKGEGIKPGTRSGLWGQAVHAIDQLRPGLVVIENVRGLLSADATHPAHSNLEPCPWCVGEGHQRPLRALGAVLGDLCDLGYDASWQGLRASDVGAPHGRFRVFIIAWPATHTGSGGQRPDIDAVPGRESDTGRGVAADAERGRRDGRTRTPRPSRRTQPPHSSSGAAADAASAERRGQEPERVASAGRAAAELGERSGVRSGAEAWGPYADAIRRWERCLGRPAPAPTELSPKGMHRLSPLAVEFMMGLPAGHVTDVPGLTRNEQLKALGNGVVPQQAAHALRILLPDAQGVAA